MQVNIPYMDFMGICLNNKSAKLWVAFNFENLTSGLPLLGWLRKMGRDTYYGGQFWTDFNKRNHWFGIDKLEYSAIIAYA